MVALVRGVHGLNGAVRVEVLTDRPEDRFVVGTVLYREGDDRPLTIATAEAVADGPGLADPLPRGRHARRRRRPARRLSRVGRPAGRGPRPRLVLLARGHRLRRARRRRRRARDGQGHLPRSARPRSSPSTADRTARFDLPAVRAFIRIFAPRRGEIVVDAESLDLRPRRSREPDPARPKAPRRRTRSRRRRPRPTDPTRRRRPNHDPRDRRPDALPGDVRGPARRRASRAASRSRASPRSGSTTCASGGSAATGPSTTPRTAGERG